MRHATAGKPDPMTEGMTRDHTRDQRFLLNFDTKRIQLW